MSNRQSPEYYKALDERMQKLLPALQGVVPLENWRWFEEWVRAGEYGLAAEVAAEGLVGVAEPPHDLCREVLAVADTMELKTEPLSRLRQILGLG